MSAEGKLVGDGHEVMRWPEFKAVVYKFDIRPVAGVYVIDLGYGQDDGREVYFDPDFVALCKRLGVHHGAYTKRIIIRIGEGVAPLIEQHYVACEPPEYQADVPAVIDVKSFLKP